MPRAWSGRTNKSTANNISVGGASQSASMAVFTRKVVEAKLSAFLGGAGASAIVTLGKEAIDACLPVQ